MNTDESKVTSKLFLAKNLNFTEGKLEKLELFANQVLSFNKRYNLISKNSEKNIWHRHILDSAQLIKHIDYKNFKSLSDLGTGAGFPGIILSIFYNDILTFHVKLYEKSKVKISFIKSVINKLELKNVNIYENDYQSHILDSGYIVSRAFKKLPEVIRISREIATKSHKLIILKGKSAQEELNKLSKDLNYKYRLETSLTNKDSRVLIVNINK